MRIEAFTEAKRAAEPDTNEDALLVLPGRAFAVMDGVTDRVGTRYDGVLSGRYASHLLQRTLERLLGGAGAVLDDPWAVVTHATAAIRGVYDAHGTTDAVAGDWNRQMAATLALVTLTAEHAHIVLVGDSGVRIDGTTIRQETKDVDTITATLRQHAWALAATRTDDPAERERVSRAFAWSGTGSAPALVAPLLGAEDVAAIGRDALAALRTRLPHLPEAAIAQMAAGGIIHGQGQHQNNPDSPLGYPSLNGFPIPRGMVRIERVPRAGLRSIELFTDGYFGPGAAFGVESWETRFREIEAEDPHKIGAYASTKGTTPMQWSDDRTYLGVRF